MSDASVSEAPSRRYRREEETSRFPLALALVLAAHLLVAALPAKHTVTRAPSGATLVRLTAYRPVSAASHAAAALPEPVVAPSSAGGSIGGQVSGAGIAANAASETPGGGSSVAAQSAVSGPSVGAAAIAANGRDVPGSERSGVGGAPPGNEIGEAAAVGIGAGPGVPVVGVPDGLGTGGGPAGVGTGSGPEGGPNGVGWTGAGVGGGNGAGVPGGGALASLGNGVAPGAFVPEVGGGGGDGNAGAALSVGRQWSAPGVATPREPEAPAAPAPVMAAAPAPVATPHSEPAPVPDASPAPAPPQPKPAPPPKPKPKPAPTPDDNLPAYPRPIARPSSRFDAASHASDEAVRVTVTIRVAADGTVTSVAVTGSSGNAAIDRAAEADCRHWRFSAAHNPKTFSQTFKHNPE